MLKLSQLLRLGVVQLLFEHLNLHRALFLHFLKALLHVDLVGKFEFHLGQTLIKLPILADVLSQLILRKGHFLSLQISLVIQRS